MAILASGEPFINDWGEDGGVVMLGGSSKFYVPIITNHVFSACQMSRGHPPRRISPQEDTLRRS